MIPSRRNSQTWLPDIFNDFFDTDWMGRMNATAPAINVLEDEKGYELELAAPGMTKEDFQVHLNEDGNLVIEMEKKVNEKEDKRRGHYLRREFSYSKFQQTMLLPEDADKEQISARVEHGVLTVELPKLKKQGTVFYTSSKFAGLQNGAAVLQNAKTKQELKLPCDAVVLALGARPQHALYDALQGKVPALYRIGDAVQVGRIADAVRSAFETVQSIQ